MTRDHESFWTAVYQPFMLRDVTRDTVRAVVRLALAEARGNYRIVLQMFNLPTNDYKRFLSFLQKHECRVPFQLFREMPAAHDSGTLRRPTAADESKLNAAVSSCPLDHFAARLLHAHDEGGATVQPARLFAGVVVLRPLLTVADGPQPVGADAAAGEVLADRVGAALAERQVVFRRADVAGVALDLDAQVRVLLQRADRLVERARRFGPQAVAVEVEVDVLED